MYIEKEVMADHEALGIMEETKEKEVVANEGINIYNNYYYGCIDNSSKEIVIDTKHNLVIEKSIYTAFNKELITYISKNNITEIYLCGILTYLKMDIKFIS